MAEFYRDYLDGADFDEEDFQRELVPLDPVDPADRGTVFVGPLVAEEDYWSAVWQRGEEARHVDGTRSDVLRWAREQESSRILILDEGAKEYVPLPPDADA